MTEAQRERVDELFGDLCELSPAEQASVLATVDDPEVRAEVASLLSHAGPSAKGLNTSIGELMQAATDSGAFEDRAIGPGTRFERYRIQQKIGQGGMGDVYEAVRENAFHKRVALKIVRYGLDSDFARTRFQQERQTLAGLEHPYIARLLDGGEAANGCPYLVLEFVDGVPIDRYCQARSRDDILTIFLKVCEAVEYAHRNLIIHRDLKPGNILVTADGTPKLLDFGIAKLLDANASVTQTMGVALTPQYTSPEQIRGQSITTASDVYSLGVILYQLLTGRKPYAIESTTPFELERVVCQEPPEPPHIGNELDDILMMALRKEPERRYASVSQLADDLRRFLAGRPVLAAPDTFRYRSRKFLGLHKIGIAAVTAVILVLAGGLASTLYQKRQAEQRFQQVRKLSNTFLFDINDQLVDIAGTTRTRAFVVKTAQTYLDNLSRSAGSDPELQAELAQSYRRVGDAQGRPRKPNLGDAAGAEASYKRAISIYEGLTRRDPKYTADTAECWRALAFLYLNESRMDEASKAVTSGFTVAAPLRGQNASHPLYVLASLYETKADIEEKNEQMDANIRDSREAVKTLDQWGRLQPASDAMNTAVELGNAHMLLGRSLLIDVQLQDAETELRTALVNTERALSIEPQNSRFRATDASVALTLTSLYNSPAAPSLEQPAKAVLAARRALELLQPLMSADPNDLPARANAMGALLSLARDLSLSGQGSGLEEVRRALALWEDLSPNPKLLMFYRLKGLEVLRNALPILSANGGAAEARELATQIVSDRRKMFAGTPPTNDDLWYLALDLLAASENARAAGRQQEADGLLDEADRVSRPFAAAAGKIIPTAFAAASFYDAMERARSASGKCAEARLWQQKTVTVWQELAASNQYSAMRLQRARSAPPTCAK